MAEPTAITIDGRQLLTHSRMAAYKTCQRKHWLSYEMAIRPERTGKPLRLGSAFHVGVDLFAQGVERDEAIQQATAGYAELPGWIQTDEQVTEWQVEYETVCAMLCGYHWRWSESPIEIVATEQAFSIPIRNPETGSTTPTFRLGGKIDKIVRLPDGGLAVMEHKTCGQSIEADSDYWARLRVDSQISTYMLAARAIGYDVQTVVYDVVRKPSIRPSKLSKAEQAQHGVERETPEMFGQRLLNDMTERPDFYFARREIPRLAHDLAEFELELWQIQQQIRESQKTGRWFRNSSACVSFGRCEYADICFNGLTVTEAETPSGYVRLGNIHPELETGDTEE